MNQISKRSNNIPNIRFIVFPFILGIIESGVKINLKGNSNVEKNIFIINSGIVININFNNIN